MSEDLKSLRNRIDMADEELISALKKRFEITAGIGEYKAETGTELFCPEREEEKIQGVREHLGDYIYSDYIADLFRDVMDYSKIQQSRNIYGEKDIFIIGMPGSGKSLIGKILSEKMFRDFIDLDIKFEEIYDESPAQVIEAKGESVFRDLETAVLKNVSGSKNTDEKKRCYKGRVISCGGGIVVRDENKDILKKNSIVIYIKRGLDKLSSKGRPLSGSIGVEKLYGARYEKYESWSDFTADNNSSPENCVKYILSELKKK